MSNYLVVGLACSSVVACENFTASNLGRMVYQDGQTLCTGLVGAPNPPKAPEATLSSPRCLVSYGRSTRIEAISLQPESRSQIDYAVAQVFFGSKFSDNRGKIELIRFGASNVTKTYDDDALKDFASNGNPTAYLSCYILPYALNWATETELVVAAQPQCLGDVIEMNVEFSIDTTTDSLISGPVYFDRTPGKLSLNWTTPLQKRTHQLKRQFTGYEINGAPIKNLPSSAKLVDITWYQ
ncbi:MAG: hypothetical protein SVC26_07590 [Pseudomonadota bacterium]|nr:hypothetical protein [Pseudomonadota bacterium]